MTKQGRPRRYECDPDASSYRAYASAEIAERACRLAELRARVRDQVEDLPAPALAYECPGTRMSIGWLAPHLIWSEIGWMRRIGPTSLPDATNDPNIGAGIGLPEPTPAYANLGAAFEPIIGWAGTMAYKMAPEEGGNNASRKLTLAELLQLLERLETEVTEKALRMIRNLSAPTSDSRLTTVAQVLDHLMWHWSYHSGQIGLVRLMWGSDYEWRFA